MNTYICCSYIEISGTLLVVSVFLYNKKNVFGIYDTFACCRLVLWWKPKNAEVNLSFEMSRESVNASKKVFKQQWNTCTN